jgi:hypothetical protein
VTQIECSDVETLTRPSTTFPTAFSVDVLLAYFRLTVEREFLRPGGLVIIRRGYLVQDDRSQNTGKVEENTACELKQNLPSLSLLFYTEG